MIFTATIDAGRMSTAHRPRFGQAEHIDGGGESGDASFDFGANDGSAAPAAAGAGRF